MKIKKILSAIIFVVFFGGLIFVGFNNFDTLVKSCSDIFSKSKSLSELQKNMPKAEENLKSSFSLKNEVADIYGLTHLAFANYIIENYRFFKGENGQMKAFRGKFNGQVNIDSVLELNEVCKGKNIPLVYVKYPDRSIIDKTESDFSGCSYYMEEVDRIYNTVSNEGVDIIDLNCETFLSKDELDYFYLNTDGHPKPYSQFLTAKYVCEQLNSKYGIEFPLFDQTFNESNYSVSTYPFIGNYSRTCGRYFSGVENFDIYHPKYETNMELIVYDNNQTRKGTYDNVCLNGYEQKEDLSEYTYFVTNYLQYPNACHEICNNNIKNGPKLLVISDSMMLEPVSFMALTSAKITIIDPRQGNNKFLVSNALLCDDYDAVIVGGNCVPFFSAYFRSCTSLPDVEERTMTTHIANKGICVEYCNNLRQRKLDRLYFDPSAKICTISGWAVDADMGDALGNVYLLIGNKVIACEYGPDNKAQSNYYKNKNYDKTGFKVTFSSSLLYDENGELYDSISVVVVSKDGTYKYTPVILPIIPQI